MSEQSEGLTMPQALQTFGPADLLANLAECERRGGRPGMLVIGDASREAFEIRRWRDIHDCLVAAIAQKVKSGHVVMTFLNPDRLLGTGRTTMPPDGFEELRTSVYDPANTDVWVDGKAVLGARFYAAPAKTVAPQSQLKGSSKQRVTPEKLADAPLVKEMRRMVLERECTSLWQAATRVASRTVGSDHGENRLKRLVRRYKEFYGNTPNSELL